MEGSLPVQGVVFFLNVMSPTSRTEQRVLHELMYAACKHTAFVWAVTGGLSPTGQNSGWPVIQHRVLHELMFSARRMGDQQLAVRSVLATVSLDFSLLFRSAKVTFLYFSKSVYLSFSLPIKDFPHGRN